MWTRRLHAAISKSLRVVFVARASSPWVLCSCWVAVVESPRGAIAVLGFMRRMCCSLRGWRGTLFNRCGIQCARGSLQHLVTHLRCRICLVIRVARRAR